MRLLIGTAIVFFGTLMAAGLVALGTPAVVDFVAARQAPPRRAAAHARPSLDAQAAARSGGADARQ